MKEAVDEALRNAGYRAMFAELSEDTGYAETTLCYWAKRWN